MPAYQFGVPASLFAPADLAKVVCWLDASHPSTVKRAGGLEAIHGANVVTWTSRVGVGIDFNEVSGSGPMLVADGSGPNARSFLRFNGTSQYLRYPATDPFASETGELWMLVKSDSAATGVTFGTADQSITTRYWYASVAATGEWEYWWDEAETADAQRNRTRANYSLKHAWYLVRYFSDGTTTNIEIDGVTEPLTQILAGGNTGSWFADATGRDNVTVGAIQRTSTGSYFAGDLAEVIVCSALLTDAEAAQLRAYFRIKYGPIYRVAALGDSLTLQPSGYADELAIALGTSGYAMGVADHGVGSEELDDIYARWVANIRGQGFERLVLLGGTNNTKNAHGPQIEFYDQILSEAIADHLGVVTITVPPFGSYVTWSPANQVALETLNAHIRTAFVDNPQVAFVELHDRIRNPANYAFLPEYNGDNLHLSNVADVLLSELVRDALISIA
jgi:hypothetical protein